MPRERTSIEELQEFCSKNSLPQPNYECNYDYDSQRQYFQVTLALPNNIQLKVVGKPEILKERAQMRSAHEMLREIALNSKLSKQQMQECGRLYALALHRGSKFKAGESIKLRENDAIEFKGAKKAEEFWNFQHFRNDLRSLLGDYICGFLNCNCLYGSKVREIYFGIHDSSTIQGIFKQLEDVTTGWKNTEDELRLLIDDILRDLNPSPAFFGVVINFEMVEPKEPLAGVLFLLRVSIPITAPRQCCTFKKVLKLRHFGSNRPVSDPKLQNMMFSSFVTNVTPETEEGRALLKHSTGISSEADSTIQDSPTKKEQ